MADPQTERVEGALTYVRIEELIRQPVQGRFDAAHLKEVHRRIFQDLPHHEPGEFRADSPGYVKSRRLESTEKGITSTTPHASGSTSASKRRSPTCRAAGRCARSTPMPSPSE